MCFPNAIHKTYCSDITQILKKNVILDFKYHFLNKRIVLV